MSNPTTRVLYLLELLQSRGQLSGRELADQLGVDGRTLRRYIATLEDLGIPIVAERGRYGGYSLVAGFKLPPMMFTNEETLAISLGLLAARELGAREAAPAAESAQAKLERVMPQNLKQRLRALRETVTLDFSPQAIADSELVATLAAAAQSLHSVQFSYLDNREQQTRRNFNPYGLVFRRGRWYAVGHCHLRDAIRSFRLDRMGKLQPLQMPFQRPRDFDAADYLKRSLAEIPRAIPVELLLRTDLPTASAELDGHMGILTPMDDGVLLQTRTGCLKWFARQLTRLPFEFSIQRPQELKEELGALARELLAIAGEA